MYHSKGQVRIASASAVRIPPGNEDRGDACIIESASKGFLLLLLVIRLYGISGIVISSYFHGERDVGDQEVDGVNVSRIVGLLVVVDIDSSLLLARGANKSERSPCNARNSE